MNSYKEISKLANKYRKEPTGANNLAIKKQGTFAVDFTKEKEKHIMKT